MSDALNKAVDDAIESPPLPRRVAGQRPTERRAAIAAGPVADREPPAFDAPEPDVPAWNTDEPDDLIPFRPEPPRQRLEPRPPARIRRNVVVAVCAVAVLAGASTAGYLVTQRPAHHRSAAPTSPGETPARTAARDEAVRLAEAWIRSNLPKSAQLHSNAGVSAELVASGYSAARLYTSIDAQGPGTYLVTTPDLRARAARSWDAAEQRIAPLPVAAFGSGASRVDVTLLVGGSATSLSHRLIRDDAERRAADTALLSNPHVQLDQAGRSQLADGQVDLRAATLVALLASRTDVRLSGVSVAAGERAVGRPARTITISLGDPSALDAVLRALPATYLPARTTALSGGERQLTWAVGLAPAGL